VVTAAGGKVIGGVKHPLNTADSPRSCCRRRHRKPKIIGMANAGGDTTNTIKQASEFGIVAGGPEARRSVAVHHRREFARTEGLRRD